MTMAVAASANSKYAGLVIDAKTGKTLYSNNADSYRFPASLTKMMTLYIMFEELEAGRANSRTKIKFSKKAWGQAPSKLGLKPGETISFQDAIMALITKSANDVATASAEHISGSEVKFARKMTKTARRIGMKRTTFKNASGLPNSAQKTTARDMALLGRALQDRFPIQYKLFKTRSFKYRGRKYGNHNKLLGRVRGVDGIKTGYIRASGFNLVTSVKDKGKYIVAVVLGGRTGKSRDKQMEKLIRLYIGKAKSGRRLVAKIGIPKRKASSSYIVMRNVPAPRPNNNRLASLSSKPALKAAPVNLASLSQNQPRQRLEQGSMDPESVVSPNFLDFAGLAVEQEQALPRASPDRKSSNVASVNGILLRNVVVSTKSNQSRKSTEPGISIQPNNSENLITGTITPSKQKTDKKHDGWVIQIGALDNLAAAERLLDSVRKKANPILVSAIPFTQSYTRNNARYIRARFAGFANKKTARRTCAALKKKKIACLAVSN
ncbi:MAG: D-alanyl-D-alanine carboxypeptidase [Cohaesibacteraceae bacterium]|nr:D-alanyl-D-alanine carboxypeptidase [Cohaesibacteraceae bacterium]MBL4876599.1 D-alanyl-D-alanine carboxypeptidase [Cohaesibacteraceae bacterium]